MNTTVISGTTAEDHARLVGEYEKATNEECHGLARRCLALHLIREKQTFTVVASTFEDFVERELGLQKAHGNLLASFGPACKQLIDYAKEKQSAIADLRIEWFKPIAGMYKRYPNAFAKQQARCLLLTKKEADKRGVPVTAGLVAEIAKERFDFISKAEWKAQRQPEPSHEQVMLKLRGHLEDAFLVLAEIGLTAEEIVEEFGSPSNLRGYLEAYPLMCDLYEHV